MQAWDFLAALRADGLPIIGLSLPDLTAPATWRFFPATNPLTIQQLDRARAVISQILGADLTANDSAPTAIVPPPTTIEPPAMTMDPPAPWTPINGETVAELLVASRGAHTTYRAALAQTPQAARIALARAAELRTAADAADPDHTDPMWASDPAPHADLMAFYTEQLNR